MIKVKFIKTKWGICTCLDNSLFNNENEQIIKIVKMIELFSANIEKYEGTFFISVKNKSIVNFFA